MKNNASFRQFVADFTRLVDTNGNDEQAMFDAGSPLLHDLVAHDDWLPEACATPHPIFYQQYLLYCDPLERFSIVSFVWGPGQRTPVHDHTVWGLIGMLRGAESCKRFEPAGAGKPMTTSDTERLEPGQIDRVSPTVGDIHEVANAYDDRVSISIHVYGANIGAVERHVFDPETGIARPFVSGYSSPHVPNFWDRSAEVRAASPSHAPKRAELLRQQDGQVTRLTLNRSQKANALSVSLVDALQDAADGATTDGTRLLILDAEGSHFCAGFDFTDLHEQSEGDLALRFIRIEALLQTLYHAPYQTLALAHGRVLGAGADLVASCGLRIAAPGSSFRMPGLRFGVALGTGRLVHRVGADRAREILATSRSFDAAEARAIGFLHDVAPKDEWPALVSAAQAAAETLPPAASAALHRRSVSDSRAEDMAELARSVAAPGLKERMLRFRKAG